MKKMVLATYIATFSFLSFAQATTYSCTSSAFSPGSVFVVVVNNDNTASLSASSPGTPSETAVGAVLSQNWSALHSQCVGDTAMPAGSVFSAAAKLVEFIVNQGGGYSLKTQVVLDGNTSAILSDGICMPASCK